MGNRLPQLRECAWCQLPIPVEADSESPYCNDKCLHAHVGDALERDRKHQEPTQKKHSHDCSRHLLAAGYPI